MAIFLIAKAISKYWLVVFKPSAINLWRDVTMVKLKYCQAGYIKKKKKLKRGPSVDEPNGVR